MVANGVCHRLQLRDHVSQGKLEVVQSRLLEYHNRHCTTTISMATFVSLVVAASVGYGSECGSLRSSRASVRSSDSVSLKKPDSHPPALPPQKVYLIILDTTILLTPQ